ncbi:hypothetical protein SMICM17S_11767 [Streptomyces microflavus]
MLSAEREYWRTPPGPGPPPPAGLTPPPHPLRACLRSRTRRHGHRPTPVSPQRSAFSARGTARSSGSPQERTSSGLWAPRCELIGAMAGGGRAAAGGNGHGHRRYHAAGRGAVRVHRADPRHPGRRRSSRRRTWPAPRTGPHSSVLDEPYAYPADREVCPGTRAVGTGRRGLTTRTEDSAGPCIGPLPARVVTGGTRGSRAEAASALRGTPPERPRHVRIGGELQGPAHSAGSTSASPRPRPRPGRWPGRRGRRARCAGQTVPCTPPQ